MLYSPGCCTVWDAVQSGMLYSLGCCTVQDAVEPDLIVTGMLAFPSKSPKNQNDSGLKIAPKNEKTTPI